VLQRFRGLHGAALVGVGIVLLSGCGGDVSDNDKENPPSDVGGTIDVAIPFEAKIGDAVFDCAATHPDLGSPAITAKITDFRFYVHSVRLLPKDGGAAALVELTQDGLWQYEDLALLDFENRAGACTNGTTETNMVIRGKAKSGTYSGVEFVLGVPPELNHGDAATAPSPLNLSGLFWSWNAGYKFLRVDAVPEGSATAFNVHLGSTGCAEDPGGQGTSCARTNTPKVQVTGFDPLAGKVVVDYGVLVSANDLSKDGGGAPGCMAGEDDPECAPIFDRLGIDLATGESKPGQQFFRGE
jgi:uncharacterized repeat protein (TIGR04052 family)